MKSICNAFLLLLSVLFVTSCQKEDPIDQDTPSNTFFPEKSIFYSLAYTDYSGTPVYFENEEKKLFLTDPQIRTYVFDMATNNDDIYIVGYKVDQETKQHTAVYWKNGQEFVLTDGTNQYAGAEAIVIKNNDVYIAGYDGKKAVYWKNNQRYEITDGTQNARAQAIFVSDSNDVHIAGYEGENFAQKAMHWVREGDVKNNILESDNHAFANGIVVKNENVYVIGKDWNTAVYWESGTEYKLSKEGVFEIPTGIFITEGNDIYISGYGYDSQAKYWVRGSKNNEIILGDGKKAVTTDIAVIDHNVYVSGYTKGDDHKTAIIWKNEGDESKILSEIGEVISIFLKK